MIRSVLIGLTALGVVVGGVRAQGAGGAGQGATDARFYPFIGCWRGDSASSSADVTLSCIVPVVASADVEIVNIADGQIVSRRRVDTGGRPRAIDEQGCRGDEQASASSLPRRIYLHSAFVCSPNGMAGGKTTLISMLPSGERLDVERVRSGAGGITRVERFRDAGTPRSVPRAIAARLGQHRLAVTTARAAAASPLQTTDVVEALHHTDASVVQAWLVATAQPFQLNGDQVASLVRADVPASVLQAMMGSAPAYQLGVGVDASGRSTDAYLNSRGIPAGGVSQITTAAPSAAADSRTYDNVNVYGACCAPVYSAYNYYGQAAVAGGYYPGAYIGPYVSYYEPYRPLRRYPSYHERGRDGPSSRRPAAPAYHSNPVGVRAGQSVSSPPRGIPSRRRP